MRRPANLDPAVWSALTASGLPFTIERGARHERLIVAGSRVAVLSRTRVKEDAAAKRLAKMTICAIKRLKEKQS